MTGPAPLGAPFHVGVVVRDLEAARAQLSELFGLEWGPVMAVDRYEVRTGDGEDLVIPTRLCYSVQEPRIELIAENRKTIWIANDESNLHHIGFWSADLAADSARLAAVGWPLELCGRNGADAPATFAYHRNPLGARIELVDEGIREAMETYLFTTDASTDGPAAPSPPG
jgi:hypothetical protein